MDIANAPPAVVANDVPAAIESVELESGEEGTIWFVFVHGKRVATPNAPKLSDARSRRGLCRWVERRWWFEAQAVTAERVRCSAWLGVAVIC